MNILIVGSGGREHALAWAIANSPLTTKLFVAPGNPGTAQCAENIPIEPLNIAALVAFSHENNIDLVFPGPEAPLVAGLADALAAANIRCCGPTAAAAALEGSKTFAKEICDLAGIPTAAWHRFTDADEAHAYVRSNGAPTVIKADGLAAGKGVTVAATAEEAHAAITALLTNNELGAAGQSLIIEEHLTGDEVSLFALCDGTDCVLIGAAQDHKRIGENDTGPNTGGMGAVSPPACFPPAEQQKALETFIRPALRAMAERGTPFRGILFAGLMLTPAGPKLIEYNVRFGDPETQALLPRLRSDLLPVLLAACDGELKNIDIRHSNESSIAVVIAERGYPGSYAKGSAIEGLEAAGKTPNVAIFHAGTADHAGQITSNGGRVLTITATGPTLETARASAYQAITAIHYPNGVFRRDIGQRAIARSHAT